MQTNNYGYNLKKPVKTFTDISLNFEPNVITKDVSVLKDTRAISNAIKNLILFQHGEVPFSPSVGSKVSGLLFENADMATASIIEKEVRETITAHEPRVELVEVDADADPDENGINLSIQYKIVGYEQVFTLETILRPTR